MMDVKVGDEVFVFSDPHRPGEPGTVVKVGRKLFTVRRNAYSFEQTFRLDTGRLNGAQNGWGVWVNTAEQVERNGRRTRAVETLRDRGVRLTDREAFTLEQVEAIADLVRSFGKES